MNTIEMPIRKFIVNLCPNSTADAIPVKIVATVDEYFFKIVSAAYWIGYWEKGQITWPSTI